MRSFVSRAVVLDRDEDSLTIGIDVADHLGCRSVSVRIRQTLLDDPRDRRCETLVNIADDVHCDGHQATPWTRDGLDPLRKIPVVEITFIAIVGEIQVDAELLQQQRRIRDPRTLQERGLAHQSCGRQQA